MNTPVNLNLTALVATSSTPNTPLFRPPETPRSWWRGGVEFGAASLCGSYHSENEDSFIPILPAPSQLAVADGVGGGAKGRVASQTLIERIRQLTPAILARPEDHLRQWLFDADDAVAAEIARYTDYPGASTFVAALPRWGQRRWQLTWVGDCRAYRLKARGKPRLLTCDDTYGNLNEPPPPNAETDDPARMVGNGAIKEVNRIAVTLHCGEILLVCSDGVHKMVPAEQMADILRGTESLNVRCRKLVAAAHTNGGTDDATVVAVQRHRWFKLGDAVWGLAIAALVAGSSLLFLNRSPSQTPKVPPDSPDLDKPITALSLPYHRPIPIFPIYGVGLIDQSFYQFLECLIASKKNIYSSKACSIPMSLQTYQERVGPARSSGRSKPPSGSHPSRTSPARPVHRRSKLH